MKSLFCFGVFWGAILKKKSIFASRQPNHVKHLLSGLNKLLKSNFHLLRYRPATPGARAAAIFRSKNCPPDFGFLSVDRNQRQGLTGA